MKAFILLGLLALSSCGGIDYNKFFLHQYSKVYGIKATDFNQLVISVEIMSVECQKSYADYSQTFWITAKFAEKYINKVQIYVDNFDKLPQYQPSEAGFTVNFSDKRKIFFSKTGKIMRI